MISTVTTATMSTVTTVAFTASLSLLAIVFLLILLINKEILSVSSGHRGQTLSKILNIAIVPLFLVFLFTTLVKVLEILN